MRLRLGLQCQSGCFSKEQELEVVVSVPSAAAEHYEAATSDKANDEDDDDDGDNNGHDVLLLG